MLQHFIKNYIAETFMNKGFQQNYFLSICIFITSSMV